ncbi:MFS transporter [Fictibacillus sp. WQ 8-8]|uniref:MFS transporter n=1 Tax=Fictibacillus sp. WQ 8-8 TaxID=2938788 RepID=UPI00210905F8|nr:MFS transporter [Fictibacillus sp. WQ 8-8]MCQ6268671.1 MFS transporter [Fictibacillus sp. WQ 8-8]
MSVAWKIFMLAAVSFLVGSSEYMIAGILDKVASDTGVSLSAAGQLLTAFSLAFAFGTPILMAATARLNRRTLLLYALILFVISNALVVVLPGYGLLLAARVVMALATGVFVVAALTVAARLAPEGKQGAAIATVLMGISASLIAGVPVGRVIAAIYDWKLIFVGIGVLSLLALPIVALSIPRTESEQAVPLRRQLAMMLEPRVALALGITFFWIVGYSTIFTYISPYLLKVAGFSDRLVSLALFGYGIASLVGSKAGGWGTDRWGVAPTLVGGMVLNMLMLTVLSVAAQTTPILVSALLMLWSFFSWSSAPTQQYYLITLAPAASGIMLSLNTSVLQFAMAVGSGLGGFVIDGLSLKAITWIAAVLVAVAAVIAVISLGATGLRFRRGTSQLERRDTNEDIV